MDNHHALLNRLQECPSPCFVVDEAKLAKNGTYCQEIRDKTGAIILLALKGYAMTGTFNTLRPYLDGTTASSLHELRCGAEHMPSLHQHIFSPAFIESEWDDIQRYASHISFNSLSNWEQFKDRSNPLLSVGLRINPEHSEVTTELYDPCKTNSRLGCLASELEAANLEGIEGFHFHTLCQSQFPELQRTVEVIESKFSKYLHQLKWLNLGGGHHLTDPNYDRDSLCHLINRLQKKYNLTVILEPGEAIALNAGYFVCTVVDILNRSKKQVILDTSASTHLADILEMPFRPHILGSHDANKRSIITF